MAIQAFPINRSVARFHKSVEQHFNSAVRGIDKMLGKVDDLVAWGADELFLTQKASPGFTVGGQSVDFRNFAIYEATLNPEWEKAISKLPKPGEKVAPAAAPGKGAAPASGNRRRRNS